MKYFLLYYVTFLVSFLGVSQPERQEIAGIGYVEVMFEDSSEVYIMMWDDFTFEYSENHAELLIVEGGSNHKETIKAKHIDYLHFLVDTTLIELNRYKSPRGRDHLLLTEVHNNGDYMILQSPSFAEPVYYYIGYQGEVFSVLPQNNDEFVQFFSCDELYVKYGLVDNHPIDLAMMKERMDTYLKNCLPPPVEEENEKKKKK